MIFASKFSQPENARLIRQWQRIILLLITSLLLISCANIKRILPFREIASKDVEPRVVFVEKQSIEVAKSQIEQVDAEIVMQSYRRLLNRNDPEVRKEALHRLADLTMRLAESKYETGESAEQSTMSAAVRNASFASAIELYETLLLEFPAYTAIDQVKYQLARAHSLNADPDSSLKILDQIAVTHSESDSYVESQFRRGESYFVRKQYHVAELAYAEVIDKGAQSEFFDKALYKRGWSLFKQNMFSDAQRDFFELYERLLIQQSELKPEKKMVSDLLLDTRRVISLLFYNMDGAESAKQYFVSTGSKPYEDQIYQALADLYIEQERFRDAADTYLGFIERNPLSLASPKFHSEVINIYRKGGFPSLILPAKESFINMYGRQSGFWKQYSGKVIEDLKPLLRLHLDDVSTFYHAKAQKSNKPADYLVAAKWYREILATFSEPEIDSKYRFLLAEALSDGGQLEQSAKEYEVVAYANLKSQYSRDAGYRALVAYQQITHPKSATLLVKLTPSILSGLKFSQAFSSDPKAPEILARVAEQQLSINDVQAAIDSSNQLLLLPAPTTLQQLSRAKIIIANGLFDLKRYAQAEVAITELLRTAKLTKAQRTEFQRRRVESVYKLAEAAKNEEQFDQAIVLFLKVKKLAPKTEIATSAHFDAATLLLQTKQWVAAADLLESFRKSYPKHRLSKTIPEKLALVYESQKNWNKAAAEYNNLAKAQTNPELAREGFYQVAQLYLKAENETKAIDAFKYYVWTYPQPFELAQEGRYQLVQLYAKQNDTSKSLFWRQKVVQFYAEDTGNKSARSAFLAAESKFILSEPLFEKYQRIKLTLPLAKSLKKKRGAMKLALNAYNSIGKYNVAQFTSESTYKVAQIYQILSQDLMLSQRPKSLAEDELEEYGYLLEEQALPFEDKAISFFEINALRTKDQIYNDAVKASIQALKKLKPAQYDKTEKLEEISSVQF